MTLLVLDQRDRGERKEEVVRRYNDDPTKKISSGGDRCLPSLKSRILFPERWWNWNGTGKSK